MLIKISTLIILLNLLAGCASARPSYQDRVNQANKDMAIGYITPAERNAEVAQIEQERKAESDQRVKRLVVPVALLGMAFGNMPTRGVVRTNTVKTGEGSYTTTYSAMEYK